MNYEIRIKKEGYDPGYEVKTDNTAWDTLKLAHVASGYDMRNDVRDIIYLLDHQPDENETWDITQFFTDQFGAKLLDLDIGPADI